MTEDVKMFGIAVVGVVLLFGSFASCTMHTDYRISQAIERGVDPIKAKCAHSAMISDAMCAATIK